VGFRTRAAADTRARLHTRREKLLSEVADLEKRRQRRGGLAPDDEARHQRLVAELEQIYGQLDQESPGPQGGGKDVAA
jgi:hypothetical protein